MKPKTGKWYIVTFRYVDEEEYQVALMKCLEKQDGYDGYEFWDTGLKQNLILFEQEIIKLSKPSKKEMEVAIESMI